jgi:glycosyltransferase involved in cell wall biosynthesis
VHAQSTEGVPQAAVAPPAVPMTARRTIAIVPARNEERCIRSVVEGIKEFDPGCEVVVVDDGSTDRTVAVAREAGARVLVLPFNLGIGGAVQTGFKVARDEGFALAVRLDGDGQHVASELPKLLAPILDGSADIVVGSRFAGDSDYRPPLARRLGIKLFASVVSLLTRQRVTDTTSGFQACNRKAIRLFAADYPHDYPEVEATVMVFKHRLRLAEVPVTMRERAAGESSIGALASFYYAIKVLLAVLIAITRRNATPLEEDD